MFQSGFGFSNDMPPSILLRLLLSRAKNTNAAKARRPSGIPTAAATIAVVLLLCEDEDTSGDDEVAEDAAATEVAMAVCVFVMAEGVEADPELVVGVAPSAKINPKPGV